MKNSYRGAMQLCWKESSKNDLRYTQNLYIYVHLYLRNWSPLLSFFFLFFYPPADGEKSFSVGGCTCCFTIYIYVYHCFRWPLIVPYHITVTTIQILLILLLLYVLLWCSKLKSHYCLL